MLQRGPQWALGGAAAMCFCYKAGSLGGAAVSTEKWLSLCCGSLCSVCSEVWPFSRCRIVFVGCWKEVVVLLLKIDFPTSGFPTLPTFSNERVSYGREVHF
jgi:hypothetical protein